MWHHVAMQPRYDEISSWSEMKLNIIREYAKAYSTVLSAQKQVRLEHIYIDGYAGAGVHVSRGTGLPIDGSPVIALAVNPPFKEYHFIDLDGTKADGLRQLCAGHSNAHVYHGDCNEVLLDQVFPRCRYEQFRRGLCLLDPYALNLNWTVLYAAGQMKSVEIFLNFMIMDMNRNVLWHNPEKVSPIQITRMNAFWGDESWRSSAYRKVPGLFDSVDEKTKNEDIVQAFRERLIKVAGFKYVPEPVPMRNSIGSDIYYLFFASNNSAGDVIARSVFNKYRNKMEQK